MIGFLLKEMIMLMMVNANNGDDDSFTENYDQKSTACELVTVIVIPHLSEGVLAEQGNRGGRKGKLKRRRPGNYLSAVCQI